MLLPQKTCFDEESMYWLSVSSGVKINQNGFLFLDTPIRMPESSSYPCPKTMGALCQHENYTFFPCTRNPRTMVLDAPEPFDGFWKSEIKCSKWPTQSNFDIIPCDLAKGTSILWSNGQISVQYNQDLNNWANLFVLLITTWLIINLGESIALILEVKGTEPRHHITVVLCIVLVSIIAGTMEDDFWATYHDLILYWFTVGYICAYAVYHIESNRTVNVIVGCMMLVSARFYQTFETPYTTTFLFLIATRFFQKCYSTVSGYYEKPTAHWIYIRLVFMAVDVVLFCLLFTFSFIPSFKEKIQAWLYLQGLLYCSLCVGSFIHQYLNSKRKV